MKINVHSIANKQHKEDALKKIRDFERRLDEKKRNDLIPRTTTHHPERTAAQIQDESLVRLEAARQQVHEIEQIGADTLVALQAQREVMECTRKNVRVISE